MLAPCDSKIGPLKDAVEEPPERAPEGELTPLPAMVRVSPLMVTPFTRRVAPSATVVADELPVAPRPKAFVISSVPALRGICAGKNLCAGAVLNEGSFPAEDSREVSLEQCAIEPDRESTGADFIAIAEND